MKIVMGIDPGRQGAICVIRQGYQPLLEPLIYVGGEVSVVFVYDWLKKMSLPITLALIEQPYVPNREYMFRNRISPLSISKLGGSVYKLKALCELAALPFQMVPAQTWKAKILVGMDWRKNKKASVQYVQRKYPALRLKRTPRCRNVWVDAADAVCIAEYGLGLITG